jgi:glutathione S-transferase
MVKLLASDIQTRDVLDWKGLHLFHGSLSSCSQKVRIFLNLKGLEWISHPVNLPTNENLSAYFLGINPRGLVPVLIDDGEVHIESNDILLYLEKKAPQPRLIPPGMGVDIQAKLQFENDLHLDLRALSFRFLTARDTSPKSAKDLENYLERGSGTVGGVKDKDKEREFDFWNRYNREGLSDHIAKEAAEKFHAAFSDVDKALAESQNILGEEFSLVDIAWIVYAERLRLAGYPIKRFHPHLHTWLEEHKQRPEIAREVALPPERAREIIERQAAQRSERRTLEDVCFPPG